MVRSLPFHLTVLPDTKLEPVIVRVNAAPPVVPVSGEIVLNVGAGLLMVKVEVFDEPPPGVGLETTIEAVPAVARSPTVIVALTCVELMKAVVRSEPFHLTTHPLTKLVPVTVKVRVPDPAFAETGFIAVRVGVVLQLFNRLAAIRRLDRSADDETGSAHLLKNNQSSRTVHDSITKASPIGWIPS